MFVHERWIRFADTDAAGVVYFANLLSVCHEAYEASLVAAGIELRQFFGGENVIPITHAEIDFRKPLHCGDRVIIQLTSQLTAAYSFEIAYTLRLKDDSSLVATALTRHICINAINRQRRPLPEIMQQWLTTTAAS